MLKNPQMSKFWDFEIVKMVGFETPKLPSSILREIKVIVEKILIFTLWSIYYIDNWIHIDFFFQCNCSGDENCESSKTNVLPCQNEVLYATNPNSVVSCSTAQWICSADPQCSTALEYYNRFCQAMFRGKKCSDRCQNSIDILQRQTAANKLKTCYCEGNEEFDCIGIKANMEKLCFENDNTIDDRDKSSGDKCLSKMWNVMLVLTISYFVL